MPSGMWWSCWLPFHAACTRGFALPASTQPAVAWGGCTSPGWIHSMPMEIPVRALQTLRRKLLIPALMPSWWPQCHAQQIPPLPTMCGLQPCARGRSHRAGMRSALLQAAGAGRLSCWVSAEPSAVQGWLFPQQHFAAHRTLEDFTAGFGGLRSPQAASWEACITTRCSGKASSPPPLELGAGAPSSLCICFS